MKATHTYVLLEVSGAAYDEIETKLRDACYEHVFNDKGEIDMHGIALVRAPVPELPTGWVLDPAGARKHAEAYTRLSKYPPHHLRCQFMQQGLRCVKGDGHERQPGAAGQHEAPKL
jgi:hypothetical protein